MDQEIAKLVFSAGESLDNERKQKGSTVRDKLQNLGPSQRIEVVLKIGTFYSGMRTLIGFELKDQIFWDSRDPFPERMGFSVLRRLDSNDVNQRTCVLWTSEKWHSIRETFTERMLEYVESIRLLK